MIVSNIKITAFAHEKTKTKDSHSKSVETQTCSVARHWSSLMTAIQACEAVCTCNTKQAG